MATARLCVLALAMAASRRPHVAVCFAATAKNSKVRSYEQTPTARLSIPSTKRTAPKAHIYVGIDDDDTMMMKWKEKIEHDATVIITAGRKNHIPFNEITRKAYEDGADYIVRINDDTEFITKGWVKLGIQALESMKPPNVGVVAPVCKQGNTAIFTHDMVHRTHLDIFNVYYPVMFDNWYVDTWITQVYQPDRSKLVKDWEVRHHLAKTRYRVDTKQRRNLANEVERGKTKITKWANKHTEATTSVDCKKFFPTQLSSALKNDLTKLLSWVQERLAPAGIDFTIAFGTALGYLRAQSMLPWDDDIDIVISKNEMKRAQKLIAAPKTGFCTANLWLGFKVFFCKSPKIKKYAWGYPFIDVFSTELPGWPATRHDLLFPSKPGVLLGVEVGTPRNSPEHLNVRYKGQDAINNCYSQNYNHSTEVAISDRKIYPCVDVYKQCYGINLKGQEKRQARSALSEKKECKRVNASLRQMTPAVLASYPGSGNSFARIVLEQTTGIATGSIYRDMSLKTSQQYPMIGENKQTNVLVVKTHGPWHKHSTLNTLPKAVIIVRNPRRAVRSYFNWEYGYRKDMKNQHRITATDEEWIRWRDLKFRAELKQYENFYSWWILHDKRQRLFVSYEKLVDKIEGPNEAQRMAKFLGVDASKCGYFTADHIATSAVKRPTGRRPVLFTTSQEEQLAKTINRLRSLPTEDTVTKIWSSYAEAEYSTKIVVFTDAAYFTLACEWWQNMVSLGYKHDELLIVGMDATTSKKLEDFSGDMQIDTFPCDLSQIWKCRLDYILKTITGGDNIILSDTDNFFQRHVPLSAFENTEFDAIHAIATTWPNDVFKTQGFVLHAGMVFYRNSPKTTDVIKGVIRKCGTRCDDQAVLNRYYFNDLGLVFDGDVSENTEYKVKLWPRQFAWRGPLKDSCPLDDETWVAMPLAEKNTGAKKRARNKLEQLCGSGGREKRKGVHSPANIKMKKMKPTAELEKLRKTFTGLKKIHEYPIDDLLLAYKPKTLSAINLIADDLPYFKDPLPQWVEGHCPHAVKYFKSVRYFDFFPGYNVPFPALQTSESAMTTVCLLQIAKEAALVSNATMVLTAGSALGAAIHGGPIPWDDDADIYLRRQDLTKFKEEFMKIVPGLDVVAMDPSIKLFHRNSHATTQKPTIRWPFIDVFLFDVKDGNLFELTKLDGQGTGKNSVPVESVLPPRAYFFGGVYLPGPNVRESITRRYDVNRCLVPIGNHRMQYGPWEHPSELNCSRVKDHFPFVHPFTCPDDPQTTLELIAVGCDVIRASVVFRAEKRNSVTVVAIPPKVIAQHKKTCITEYEQTAAVTLCQYGRKNKPGTSRSVAETWYIEPSARALLSESINTAPRELNTLLPNLNKVEWDNSLSRTCDWHQDGILRVVAFNAARGGAWKDIGRLILGDKVLKNADVILLNEMDIGMARSGNVHTTRMLAKMLEMNYAWGVEFFELSRGNKQEQKHTVGLVDNFSLHGNAILSRCPLARARIIRDSLPDVYFNKKPSFTNAYGYEQRLGGRMALVADIIRPLNNTTETTLTLVSSHKLGKGLETINSMSTRGIVIMGGDQKCTQTLSSVNQDSSVYTVPVISGCKFHETRKHQGDHICSNAVPHTPVHIAMPCSSSVSVISDHAFISADIVLERNVSG